MSRPCLLTPQLSKNNKLYLQFVPGHRWRGSLRPGSWTLTRSPSQAVTSQTASTAQTTRTRRITVQSKSAQPSASPSELRNWNISFPVAALTATTRTRNIWEPWRWDLIKYSYFPTSHLHWPRLTSLSVGRGPSQGPASQVWGVGGPGGRGWRLHQPGGWERSATGDSLQAKEQVRPASSLPPASNNSPPPPGLRTSQWSQRRPQFYQIRENFKWRDSRWVNPWHRNILD